MEKKTSEAQEKANKRWAENNKAYSSYLKSRSSARSFIRNKATHDDLEEFEALIEDRYMGDDTVEKQYIRVFLWDTRNNPIICNRNDECTTSIDVFGYEDLDMKSDKMKLELYLNVDYIDLYNGKTYKIVQRNFMPTRPVSLYLTLEEVSK